MEHFPTKEKLHTDVLEEKYGPIHSDVRRHDNVREAAPDQECIREARLVDADNVLRTYALTFLSYDRKDQNMLKIDDKIRAGGLIGKTFREHGFTVKKNVIDVFFVELPDWMKKDFRVTAVNAKARITEFYAKDEKDPESVPVIYGDVLEIYSPDFRDPADGINENDKAQVNPATKTFAEVGIPIHEVWSRLDRASETDEWSDKAAEYESAQALSEPVVRELRHKIDEYLQTKT